MVKVAAPAPFSATVATLAPSIAKVSEPAGTPEPLAAVTLPVNVTASPIVLGLSDDWIEVEVFVGAAGPAMQMTLIDVPPSTPAVISDVTVWFPAVSVSESVSPLAALSLL